VDLSGGAGSSPSPAPSGGNYGGGGYGGSAGGPPAGSYGGGQPAGGGGGAGIGFAASAAQTALGNAAVQEQLKAAVYESLPSAQQGLSAARVGASAAVTELHKYVQEGPAGISMLCFVGGGATTFAGVIGLLNLGQSVTSPFSYVLNAYLTCFGVVTFLLEADVESVRNMKVLGRFAPLVEGYQEEVFRRAQFLTELRGRGFYYLFVGSLAITQCFFCLFFLVGAWNVLMGVLCLMMSFGINPTEQLIANGHGMPEQNTPLYNAPHGP